MASPFPFPPGSQFPHLTGTVCLGLVSFLNASLLRLKSSRVALDVTELVGALKVTLARQGSEKLKGAGSQQRRGGVHIGWAWKARSSLRRASAGFQGDGKRGLWGRREL